MSTSIGLRAFQSVFRAAFRSQRAPYRIPRLSALHLSTVSPRSVLANNYARRNHSTDERPAARPLTDRSASEELGDADKIALRKAQAPAYQLWFTCKKCLERSGHTVSKQSYHFGTCLIQCPKCRSQHLISDHMKIFSDTNLTLEDIAKEHGQKLRKGRLGADGDVEFYDDDAPRKVP